MAFERNRVATKEKRAEYFDAEGHFTDKGIDEMIYGKLGYDPNESGHLESEAHQRLCKQCRDKIESRRDRDSGGHARGVPVGDRD